MRFRQWIRLAAAVVLVSGVAVREPDVAAYSEALSVPLSIALDECLVCTHGDCESGDHLAWDMDGSGIEVWTRNGGAHLDDLCRSGTCDTMHGPTCIAMEPMAAAEFESLRIAVAQRDMARVNSIAAANPSQVTINANRGAIQIIGCGGGVIAHLPLPTAY